MENSKDDKLITENINLAYDLAWKYYRKFGRVIEIDELKSESLLGLVKAAKTFDASKGYAFSTYAYKVILYRILVYYKLNKKYLNNKSLHEMVSNKQHDDETELVDVIPDNFDMDEELEKSLQNDFLYKTIETLPEKQRDVLKLYLSGCTQKQIAKKLNISEAVVSTHLSRGKNILRYRYFHNYLKGGKKPWDL